MLKETKPLRTRHHVLAPILDRFCIVIVSIGDGVVVTTGVKLSCVLFIKRVFVLVLVKAALLLLLVIHLVAIRRALRVRRLGWHDTQNTKGGYTGQCTTPTSPVP